MVALTFICRRLAYCFELVRFKAKTVRCAFALNAEERKAIVQISYESAATSLYQQRNTQWLGNAQRSNYFYGLVCGADEAKVILQSDLKFTHSIKAYTRVFITIGFFVWFFWG